MADQAAKMSGEPALDELRALDGTSGVTPASLRAALATRGHPARRSTIGPDGTGRGLAGDDSANAVTPNEAHWSRAACEQVDWILLVHFAFMYRVFNVKC
jgi:hypothetical protein